MSTNFIILPSVFPDETCALCNDLQKFHSVNGCSQFVKKMGKLDGKFYRVKPFPQLESTTRSS